MMMDMNGVIVKARRKVRAKVVALCRRRTFYPALYASWWHSLAYREGESHSHEAYMTAVPNPGAGIGHQLANWIAGLWFAEQFQLKHAHVPFSSFAWEKLLGFGDGAITAQSLIDDCGYHKVLLPLFDEFDENELQRSRAIVSSYSNEKVVFFLEQDQFYRDQWGVIEEIRDRFHGANARCSDKIVFDPDDFNIAIHVRRGDIVQGQVNKSSNLQIRWQSTDYFHHVLSSVLHELTTDRQVRIYLFSQGDREEFSNFDELGDIEYCLDWDAEKSFLHMVYADLLITSKSSFSYKPALLSRGIKVCPARFWHGYPQEEDWVLADEDGSLGKEAVARLVESVRRTRSKAPCTPLRDTASK